MSTFLNSLILRSSIALLGSTAINFLAAVENLGQEIQHISEDSIENEANFPSVSKQKKLTLFPSLPANSSKLQKDKKKNQVLNLSR